MNKALDSVSQAELDAEKTTFASGGVVAPQVVPVVFSPDDGYVLNQEQFEKLEATLAAASGSTSLPLSDQDTAWDAGAAKQSLSEGQYADAHFWRDPDGDPKTLAAYKLPFAKNSPPLTAVWRGVTASAAAIQGSRGGVNIPEADVAGVKSRIATYYGKAAKKYDDPSIKVPWETSSEDAVEILSWYGWITTETDDVVIVAAVALANAEAFADPEVFAERFDYWKEYFMTPERAALALVQEFANGDVEHDQSAELRKAFESAAEGDVAPGERCSNCDHTAASHEGDDNMGACTIEGCDCDGMQPEEETSSESESATTEEVLSALSATKRARYYPDEEQVAEIVKLTLRNIITEDRLLPHFAEEEAVLPKVDPPAAGGLRWVADAVFEGVLTDDFRAFAPGSLTWRQLPLTLGAMLDTPHADVVTESRAAGSITDIERVGNTLVARGVFDTGEYGTEIARMVSDGVLRGISVDVAVAASEVAPKLDFFDENGNWRDERVETSNPEGDLLDVLFGDEEMPIYVITEGTIGAITVCPFPAFADARIEIAASLVSSASPAVATTTRQHGMVITGQPVTDEEQGPPPTVVTASAVGLAPAKPKAEWFENPEFDMLTALTVFEDGRVFGHAAPWDQCHIAIPDVCTTAPHTQSDYDFFHLKEVECEDGTRIHCGTITLDTGHAPRGLSHEPAAAHYDDTGTAVADVVVGEDDYGIWLAGALRPDISEEQARKLRGAVLSGDWRRVEFTDGSGNLELVALLAVNVPGFPVPRTRALVAAADDGTLEVISLVAAGIHAGASEEEQLEKIKVLGSLDKFRALAQRAQS